MKLGAMLARTLRHFFPDGKTYLGRLRDPRDPGRIVCHDSAGTGHGGARNASFHLPRETALA